MKQPTQQDWWNNRAFALNHHQPIEKPNGTGATTTYQSEFAESYLFPIADTNLTLIIEIPKGGRAYRFMFFQNSVENVVLRSDCIYRTKHRAYDAGICMAVKEKLLPHKALKSLYNKHEFINPIYELNKPPQ